MTYLILQYKPGTGFFAPGEFIRTLDDPNPYGTSTGDTFGFAIDATDTHLIAGAFGEDEDGNTQSGKAYIFNITDGSLIYTLDNPNAYDIPKDDFFGYAVAINSTYAAVGAYGEDEPTGFRSGYVYIYELATGQLINTIKNPNPVNLPSGDEFGRFIDMSENYLIVGALEDSGGTNSGTVYIYSLMGSPIGTLLHTIHDPNAYGTPSSDYFGQAVGISDSYAIVGALNEDDADGTQSGKAYIFDTATGDLLHTLNNPSTYGTSTDDFFGSSVSIDENYAVVGASGEDTGFDSAGIAYIFNSATGALLHTIQSPNPTVIANFGESSSILGTKVLVSEPSDDDGGKVHAYDAITGNLLYSMNNVNAYGTSVGDNFGKTVTMTGSYVVIGAPYEDDPDGGSAGKVYIFKA